jgi:phage baseplate assembly protein W
MTARPTKQAKDARGAKQPQVSDAYPAFLGTGWTFPPIFDRVGATVVMASGETDIRESLWVLLSTNIGERIMLATYGCDLWSQVFASLTTTKANEIANMVTNAIIEWEPRVAVETVSVSESLDGTGWLEISINYWVRQTNTRSNLVYPFYRRELTIEAPRG